MINRDNYQAMRKYLEYLLEVRQNEENTIKRRRIQLRHLLEWADEKPFSSAPAIRPTFPRYLAQNRNDSKTEPLAVATVVRALGAACEFFEWLRSSEPSKYKSITNAWLGTLRAAKVKQTQPPSREVFTVEDVRQIIALPHDTLTDWRNQAAIAFLFLSGMRVGALVTLTLECVDLASHSVKQWPALGVRTKNSKVATTYLLDIPDLLTFVKGWDTFIREQLPSGALWYASLNTDGMQLTGATVAGVERRAMVAKGIMRMCGRAEIPYHSPHKLRHGHTLYALKRAQTIADLKAISQNLMHASLTVTDSIYGVLAGDDVSERIAGLNAVNKRQGADILEEIKRLLLESNSL